MAPVSKSLSTMNIESLGIVFDGILVKSPMQLIEAFVSRDYPQFAFLFAENTFSYELIQSVIGMGIKLVYFIISLIIMFTIYALIVFIIWLIVRKPLRKLFIKEYDIALKHKVRFKSRLGGFGIGITKGLIYMLLICLFFAGAVSIVGSIENVVSSNDIALVCMNDSVTVVELGTSNDPSQKQNINSEYQEIFDLADTYRETIPGKVFGTLKFGKNKTTIDEAMFDSIFSMKTQNGKMAVRKEIQKIG